MSKDKKNNIEEEIDGVKTGIEGEKKSTVKINNPWDPELIRVDPKSFSLRNILDMIDEGALELTPDFQRNSVWNPEQKAKLIESLLLRIPLPAFYFSEDKNGKYQVIDGLQRLSAIHEFVRGGDKNKSKLYPLNKDYLEYLKNEVGGKQFSDIESAVWGRRINSTQIIVNVVDPKTPSKVKFDIFKRINTGGTPLSPQEIRHCMSTLRSRNFLKKLAESKAFKQATNNSLKPTRMVDREIVLRLCSFYISFYIGYSTENSGHCTPKYNNLINYEKAGTMDAFLTELTEIIDNALSDNNLEQLNKAFENAMVNAYNLFGTYAFRKWPAGDPGTYPINRALFEAWGVVLAPYKWDDLKLHKNDIINKARYMMKNDGTFINAISSATSMTSKVRTRFEKVHKLIKECGL